MGPQGQQVFGRDGIRNSILGWVQSILIHKGAKQAVPNNQYAAIIAVDITGVAAMMYPMMARRVEQPLDCRMKAPHQSGMDKKLVDQRQGIGNPNPNR